MIRDILKDDMRDVVQDDFEEIFKISSDFVDENFVEKTGKLQLDRCKEVYDSLIKNEEAYKRVYVKNNIIQTFLIMSPHYTLFNFDKRAISGGWVTNTKLTKLARIKACIYILEDMFNWAEKSEIKHLDLNMTHESPSILKILDNLGFVLIDKIYTTEV